MRTILQLIFILIITSWIAPSAFAQPCLTGWTYRQTIEMNNSGSALSNHQVSVNINTQVLVALGKTRVDGGDIRFTDASGNTLSFWYDPSEFNSSSTTFWIKANVNAAVSNIFMFYGNATSSSASSGEGTFELFDTFNSGSISPLLWDKCGNNINLNVVGGTATFQSSNLTTPKDYLITSKQKFTDIVVTEMKVNSASSGRSVIGVVDTSNDGYVNVFENGVMKMMKVSPGGDCRLIQTLTVVNSPSPTAVAGISGITGFVWKSASTQTISWPSGFADYTASDKSTSFGTAKSVLLGTSMNSAITNGSVTIDYVRVRKHSDNSIVLSPTDEHEAPENAIANNTGPYCGGESIVLSTDNYTGALYSWTGPNGFTSTDQNPTPFASSTSYSGTYTVNITMPGGCNASNIISVVDVSTASVAGSITGAVTLCEGFNSGTLNLGSETGSILRWEMSNSSIGPWVTLSNTANTLNYQNLSDTSYYRSVVKSGACPQAISAPLQVNIDKATVGGFTLGTDIACDGLNAGDINLVYHNGDVIKWEESLDGATWTDITSINTIESYSNLTATTYYRAQVKSGVCPAKYSAESIITVNPNPVSDFNASTECEGYSTLFTNNSNVSAGSIVNYSWNFGNGSGSIAQDPINQYTGFGTYTVTLTSETDKGCNNIVSKTVNVNANPNVDFNFTNVCLGQPMNFQSVIGVAGSSISGLDWSFDDGNTSNQTNVNHTYATANSFDVTLVATSAQGCIDSIIQTVEVAQPVSVDFIADSVCLGEAIQFNNISSSGSSSVQYSWNFGDGTTSLLTSPNHTYGSKGVYSVILQASISGGASSCQSSKTLNVEIYEKPSANFSFSDECLSDTVAFINQSIYTGGLANLTHYWNFNDGNTSTSQDNLHKYSLSGLYNVSLDVETVFGCTSSISQQVEIFEMPIANFTSTYVCFPEISNFTNTSLFNMSTMSFQWNFDDGNTSTAEAPSVLYAADGDFQVELITTTANGCLDTIVKQHTVYAKPIANFKFDDVCDGYLSSFTDTSLINSGTINSFAWDFGDGSTASGIAPNHQYLNVGIYAVKLAVISDQFCSHDTTLAVEVYPNPIADFTIVDACLGTDVAFTNTSIVAAGTMSNLWEFGDGMASNQNSPTNLYALAGLYTAKLIVTTGEGCVDSVEHVAEVFAAPVFYLGNDTIISLGDEIELNGFYSGAIGYVWTPGDGLDNNSLSNPIANPTAETNYILTVTDGNGCVGQDSINIEVNPDFNLVVNNLITPDNNGVNDFWEIGNIENYSDANVYVYDRWGSEVLKTTNYQNDWNGVSGTDQLPDGTYYYIITVPGQEKVYKGGITVLRNK